MAGNRVEMLLKLRDMSWDKEGWFLPLAPALEGLTAAQAAWQPPGGGNTIWQTLNHLNYYNEKTLCRLTGETFTDTAANNDGTFGAPGSAEQEEAWQAAVAKARRVAEGLRRAISALTDEELDKPGQHGTMADRLTSWIMHDSYHTGQIVLLRKMQQSWPAHRDS